MYIIYGLEITVLLLRNTIQNKSIIYFALANN